MEKEKKKGKGKTIVIVLLILIILGLVSYIVYDKDLLGLKKDSNKENIQEAKEETISDQEAQELLDKFGVMDVYLGGTVFDRGGYSDDYKNYVVLRQLEDQGTKGSCEELLKQEIEEGTVKYRDGDQVYETPNGVCQEETVLIDYDDANALYQEMFGRFPSMVKNSTSFQVEGYYYSNNQNGFIKTYIPGGGSDGAVYAVAYKDATLDGDTLTIEVYHKCVNMNDDGTYTVNDKKIDSNEEAEQEVLKNKDQMDIYKVIFIKENDHFIFNRITQ